MRLFLLLSCAFLLAAPAAATAQPAKMEDAPTAVLRMIDKVSARTDTFDVPVDKTIKFGDGLFIKVRACRKAPPLAPPESAAFLQIWERPPGEDDSRWVFSGWMFASNPAVSAMDHPVYDVWVIACKNDKTSASAAFTEEAAPAESVETSGPSDKAAE